MNLDTLTTCRHDMVSERCIFFTSEYFIEIGELHLVLCFELMGCFLECNLLQYYYGMSC